MRPSRRHLLGGSAAALAFAGLARYAQAQTADVYRNEIPGYGPLVTDPEGLVDLPEGFSYRVISQQGETMDDGFFVPGKFDGMGCFAGDGTEVILVRNHEVKLRHTDLGPAGVGHQLRDQLDPARVYDTYEDGRPLGGGTTTLVYDLVERRVVRQFLSLTGTSTNCAGGVTPWGSWLTCEETNARAGEGVRRDHGWVFEVPSRATGLVDPVPLTALGRFEHEAACVDPRTGYVYLTEDRDDSVLYRFVPNTPGRLADGGRLSAMAIASRSAADLRNWETPFWEQGESFLVRWVPLDQVESPDDDLRTRAHAAGAALIARGEGIAWGEDDFYVTATGGGVRRFGQIIRVAPGVGDDPCRAELFYESQDDQAYDYGDNLTVAPWGDLLVCEDRYSTEINHLRGITPEGQAYTIARNVHAGNGEFCGVCVSPDGSTVFVNIQDPGMTLAITGPWHSLQSS
jgi:secreted PhoX family phosphatase